MQDNKTFFTFSIIATLVVVILGFAYFATIKSEQPRDQGQRAFDVNDNQEDTLDAINEDLSEVELGDLDAEFMEIDNDLNSL